MRATSTVVRPRFLPRGRAASHKPQRIPQRHTNSSFSYMIPLCATILIAGYLPGIWLGRDGQTLLGQQLASYYTDTTGSASWIITCLHTLSGPFLQIVLVLLCGFSALGLGFLTLYFFGKGVFLGFCAANVFSSAGTSGLIFYWFCTCLPDLIFTTIHLWLAVYAMALSRGLFQSIFLGGAPRGQLHAASRRLLVRSGIAFLASGLLSVLFSGLRFLLSPLFL